MPTITHVALKSRVVIDGGAAMVGVARSVDKDSAMWCLVLVPYGAVITWNFSRSATELRMCTGACEYCPVEDPLEYRDRREAK